MINIDTSLIDQTAMGSSEEYLAEVQLNYSYELPQDEKKNAEPDLRITQNSFLYKRKSQGQCNPGN